MKKKASILLLVTALFIALAMPVWAENISLKHWYSDADDVYYATKGGSFYVRNYSTDTTFSSNFQAGIINAQVEWNNILPFNISETSFNYATNYVYAGPFNDLKSIFPNLMSKHAGLTIQYYLPETKQSVKYLNQNKNVYEMYVGSKMCVVQEANRSLSSTKSTATHEMGHLFGWVGESYNSKSVMYYQNNGIYKLKSSDIDHIKQIFYLFY